MDALILLPLLPILFLTYVRWRTVYDEICDFHFTHSVGLSFRLYKKVLQATIRLIADIIMIPGALIIGLTVYRVPTLYMYSAPVRHIVGPEWHIEVTFSCLLIVHDLCLLSPCMLVALVIGTYRVPKIIKLIKSLITGERKAQRIEELRLQRDLIYSVPGMENEAVDPHVISVQDEHADGGGNIAAAMNEPSAPSKLEKLSDDDKKVKFEASAMNVHSPTSLESSSSSSSSPSLEPSAPVSENTHVSKAVKEVEAASKVGWDTTQKYAQTQPGSSSSSAPSLSNLEQNGDDIAHVDAVITSQVQASDVVAEQAYELERSDSDIVELRTWALNINDQSYDVLVEFARFQCKYDGRIRLKMWKTIGK